MAAARPYEGFSGKVRRRPVRRAAETPYDRPASAYQSLRIQSAAAAEKKKGWLSKLVHPLRIIASSASRIFSFQTCLTAPPEAPGMVVPCTDENHHSCKGFFDVACTIPEEEFASRAEVGKGYMGSRTSKAPSSAQSLRNQLFREDSLPSIIPYGRQISQISTAPKFVTHFSRISERHQNGYMTPVRIGRSAMHRMSRSPYFGAIPATNIKVHKRGSSVLDNDLGCPGHIRRLRQKSDLRSPSKDIQRLHGKDKLDVLSDFDLQKPGSSISLKQGKIANTDESAGPSTSGVQLNETVGAVNPITTTDAKADLQKLGSSISLKQGKIANTDEPAGPCTSGVELIQTVGSVNPITATDAKDGSSATDLVISGSVAVSSGRRPGFQMRAPEVDFDLDDDAEVAKAEEFDSQASTSTPTFVSTSMKRSSSTAFEGDAVARVSKKLRVEVGKAEEIASGEPSTYESLGCAYCCDVGFPPFIQWKHCPHSNFA